MNTNPNAKRILVFGDSNTWGQQPDFSGSRFDTKERYPGVLQDRLGTNYEVIEEGLCARTICVGADREKNKGRIGIDYLLPCINTYLPLDLLVINLGTNECKKRFGLSARQIAANLEKMCELVRNVQNNAKEEFKVLITAPGQINESKAGKDFEGGEELSKTLAPLFEDTSKQYDFYFLDLREAAGTGEDGLHYTRASHQDIANAFSKKIKSILEEKILHS